MEEVLAVGVEVVVVMVLIVKTSRNAGHAVSQLCGRRTMLQTFVVTLSIVPRSPTGVPAAGQHFRMSPPN